MRISDWSSDVCSSDLVKTEREHLRVRGVASQAMEQQAMLQGVTKGVSRVHSSAGLVDAFADAVRTAVTGRAGPAVLEIPEDIFFAPAADETMAADPAARSEERSVGKEGVSTCRSRWSP